MEIGDQLRAEMGGQRFTANATEIFEPADPRRTMPKSAGVRDDHRPDRDRRADELAEPALARVARRGKRDRCARDGAGARLDACRAAAGCSRRRRPAGRSDRQRAGVAAGQRKGRSHALFRHAAGGSDLRRARNRHRAGAEDRQARSAAGEGRRPGRAARWASRDDREQCQPSLGRSDEGRRSANGDTGHG